MAYGFVDAVEASDTGGVATKTTPNFSTSVAVGDLIIATATCTSGTAFTFTDTLLNTYTVVDTVDDSGNSGKKLQMAYCLSASAGTNAVTVVSTLSSDPIGIHAARYTGIASSSTLNAHGNANQGSPGTGANAVTASCTTTNNPCLLYGFTFYTSRNVVPSAGTGLTGRGSCWGFTTTPNSALAEDKRVTSNASQSATFTIGTNNSMLTIVGAFLEASGAASSKLLSQLANQGGF